MAGHVGTKIRLRYLPHYDGRIEVFSTEGGAGICAARIWRRRRRWSSVVR
ncbi:hypothetical protein ACFWBF_25705 [Streptomyces sp. NPDC060028]